MPVKINPELAKLRAAAKAPREGYFSVLDELMGELPQDRPFSAEEIRQRMKPGRMLLREGLKFPLKQEEIDYALNPVFKTLDESMRMPAAQWRDHVRKNRPEFTAKDSMDVPMEHSMDYSEYATHGPGRRDYFEIVTESPDFGEHKTHFTPQTLSFSRGTQHDLSSGAELDLNGALPEGRQRGMLRLIDEIQNDRANDARQKRGPVPADIELLSPEDQEAFRRFRDMPGTEQFSDPEFLAVDQRLKEAMTRAANQRRGWRTPEMQQVIEDAYAPGTDKKLVSPKDLHAYKAAAGAVPDAPFKDPKDYGRLEIKNQLLAALDADDDYLGVTPASGPASWFPGTGAKDTTYDNLYPGELKKIAQQYGANFDKVNVPIVSYDALNLPSLSGTDLVDRLQVIGELPAHDALESYKGIIDDMIRGGHLRGRAADKFDELTDEVKAVAEAVDDGAADESELIDILDTLADEISMAYNSAAEKARRGGDPTLRAVPSMHLTPDVKERIARIGLPLFTAAGASMALPELAAEDEAAAPPMYADGGPVRRAAGALKTIREAQRGRAGAERGHELRWLEDAAGKASAGRARGDSGESAQSYGAWAESRPTASRGAPAGAKKEPKQGALSTMRRYLGLYQGGSVALADQYPDAIEGAYEPGDEFLGEDDHFEYYACGGPVKRGLGGKLKKAVKKVAKVVKSAAPVLGMIPGVGTVAGGILGGVSGLIADGNLKGALSGALGGASGGISNVLGQTAMQLGSGLLDASNAKKSGASMAAATDMAPERIADVPDLVSQKNAALAMNAAAPTELSRVQPQTPRIAPGSNAGSLLSRIQQQQALPAG